MEAVRAGAVSGGNAMLKRVTMQIPPEWYAALEAERYKSGLPISELLRHMVRRSLGARGYRLKNPEVIPGHYDRAEKGLLGDKKQREHDRREKNRQRVRRQLERRRVARQQGAFHPRFYFDTGGGVWTFPEYEELGYITYDGELRLEAAGVTEEEIVAELRRRLELFPSEKLPQRCYALLGIEPEGDEE
jgi:hypothetical protein